jgi:hypothetical protein
MPLREVPGTDIGYYLVLFDKDGDERAEGTGEKLSSELLDRASRNVTDIFVLSHGWKGDVPAAIAQYDAWIGAMAAQTDDRARVRVAAPDFGPLVVGVHWPSLPWGVEDVDAALLGDEDEADELAAEDALSSGQLIDLYAERLNDTPTTRAALTTILSAVDDPEIESQLLRGKLTQDLLTAYDSLFEQAGLGLEGALGAPGSDQATFDPAASLNEWLAYAPPDSESEGLTLGLTDTLTKVKNALLWPVRQLSFWTMKKRARTVGESGVHGLLRALQSAAPDARLHLMGHSFGCIVVSSAIAGPTVRSGAPGLGLSRAVDSVFLVQGAMSLWSYAAAVPFPPFSSGYFRPLLEAPAQIRGPVVTTLSEFDTAVGKFYPLGAQAGDDFLLGEDLPLPKFGGIGAFGIQGADAVDVDVLPTSGEYDLAPGLVYNVDASSVISNGSGASGAHSDICHPEIAHLMWEAVITTLRR